jgi:hypothetical protein
MASKRIDTYLLGNCILLHAKRNTSMGLDVFSTPVFRLPASGSEAVIALKIKEALKHYSFGHRHPSQEECKSFTKMLANLGRCKSAKIFFDQVKRVSVTLEDDYLIFCPSLNKGIKYGFHDQEHLAIELPFVYASDEEIGQTLLQCFRSAHVEIVEAMPKPPLLS